MSWFRVLREIILFSKFNFTQSAQLLFDFGEEAFKFGEFWDGVGHDVVSAVAMAKVLLRPEVSPSLAIRTVSYVLNCTCCTRSFDLVRQLSELAEQHLIDILDQAFVTELSTQTEEWIDRQLTISFILSICESFDTMSDVAEFLELYFAAQQTRDEVRLQTAVRCTSHKRRDQITHSHHLICLNDMSKSTVIVCYSASSFSECYRGELSCWTWTNCLGTGPSPTKSSIAHGGYEYS